MAKKRFTVEQIINHLREADVLLAQGETVGGVCRRIGVSEQSYYRWRREYGGLKVDQARRLNVRYCTAISTRTGVSAVPIAPYGAVALRSHEKTRQSNRSAHKKTPAWLAGQPVPQPLLSLRIWVSGW